MKKNWKIEIETLWKINKLSNIYLSCILPFLPTFYRIQNTHTTSHTHSYIYIYIYIYTYIVIHRQTVVSQFSVWLDKLDTSSWDRNPPNFTLGRLLTALPFRRPTSAQEYNHFVSTFDYFHFTLSDTGLPNSLEELCITQLAAINSFFWVLNPREGSVYIVIYRQAVSLYHNSSVWPGTQDPSTHLTLRKTLYLTAQLFRWHTLTPSPECSPPPGRGAYILSYIKRLFHYITTLQCGQTYGTLQPI